MSQRPRRRTRADARRKTAEREASWDTSFHLDKLPSYKPLLDHNLRHHFENPRIQERLHSVGLIDAEGRVIDMEKYKSKLAIIEQEFTHAEQAELRRIREEREMRERVRKKRFSALDEQRKRERLERIKEDRRIRREMLRATYETRVGPGNTPFFGSSTLRASGSASLAGSTTGSAGGGGAGASGRSTHGPATDTFDPDAELEEGEGR